MSDDPEQIYWCMGCEETDFGTREQMTASGWLIEDDTCLCSLCNTG